MGNGFIVFHIHPQERIKSEFFFYDAIICIINVLSNLTSIIMYSLLLPCTIIHLIASAFLELSIHYTFTTFRACLKANWSYAASCSFFTETRQLIIIFYAFSYLIVLGNVVWHGFCECSKITRANNLISALYFVLLFIIFGKHCCVWLFFFFCLCVSNTDH